MCVCVCEMRNPLWGNMKAESVRRMVRGRTWMMLWPPEHCLPQNTTPTRRGRGEEDVFPILLVGKEVSEEVDSLLWRAGTKRGALALSCVDEESVSTKRGNRRDMPFDAPGPRRISPMVWREGKDNEEKVDEDEDFDGLDDSFPLGSFAPFFFPP